MDFVELKEADYIPEPSEWVIDKKPVELMDKETFKVITMGMVD